MNSVDDLDLPVRIPHEFEVELNLVIVTNHRFTMEQINTAEHEDQDELYSEFRSKADAQVLGSALSHSQIFYADLRQAANRLALVGAVTRLGDRVAMLVRDTESNLLDKKTDTSLISQLIHLDSMFKGGPDLGQYFKDLVDVRDSIIHANSKAEWHHKRERSIVDRYKNAYGSINFSNEDLGEAITKMVQQVSWYDEQIKHATDTTSSL